MNQSATVETKELLSFIAKAPTAFHAVDEIERRLMAEGYRPLSEGWSEALSEGGKYYLTRNRSSVIAFRLPCGQPRGFLISATHTDTPSFRLKSNCESELGGYLRLLTERYGGSIYSSWLDRPLSVAGRVVVRDGNRFLGRNVMLDRDLVLIPNVAIHMNRKLNDGYTYNPAVDLLPLAGEVGDKGALRRMIAESAGVDVESIVSADLSLYDRTPGAVWGLGNEFFSSSRIDNLECTYATLSGFLSAPPAEGEIAVFSAFDNEEVGSRTKQGADSDFLYTTLASVASGLGLSLSSLLRASFFVSADNAHGRHPNHPELSDGQNAPELNGGVVIKHNAAQQYTTDAVSEALFSEVCVAADVPTQHFSMRSDMLCGSTLGAIANAHVAPISIDIGLAQLAMHSAYETAGCADLGFMIRAMRTYFSSELACRGDGDYTLKCQ